LYGDTDSIFVKLKNNDSVLDEGFELERLINESYNDFAKQFGADKNEKLEISFEKLYSTCIFVGVKKRYIGRVIWKGSPTVDMDSTGFESRRKDTPPWAHDCLVTFYNMLLDGKDKKIILDFIKSKIKELNNVTVADVGITQRFGKDINDYTANMPMHVRGAKYSIEHLHQNFSRLDYGKIVFISKVPVGYPYTDVITLKENTSLPDGFELDKKRIFKRLIEMKIKDLIGLIGLDVDEIFGQAKLEAWFNG
jgi:DNA polymerase elongation subunit (family B)